MVVCGIEGSNKQRILDSGSCGPGEVQMDMDRPSPEHVAAADGTWNIDMAALKTKSKDAVDNAAGEARRAWVSDGFGVMQEYAQAEAEAKQYLDAVSANGNDPTGIEVPSSVQSAADYIGGAALGGANDVLSKAAVMRASLNNIRAERLARKASIEASQDVAAINAEVDAASAALKLLMP